MRPIVAILIVGATHALPLPVVSARPNAQQSSPAAAAQPESVKSLLDLSRAQARDGDTRRALETLRRARTLAPNSEEVLSAFAQMALATKQLGPALATLDALTRMCGEVAQYHYWLGVALMQAGDIPSALDTLQTADRLEPNRPLTLIALGLSFNAQKMHAEAKDRLTRALEAEPDNLDAMAALAEAHEGLDAAEDAEKYARKVLARVPDQPVANLVIGLVRMKQARYAEAREALERAATGNPDSAKVHYQLSLVHARLGDLAASEKHRELYQQKLRALENRVKILRDGARPSGGTDR